jgi:hypothetical protein
MPYEPIQIDEAIQHSPHHAKRHCTDDQRNDSRLDEHSKKVDFAEWEEHESLVY